MAPGICDMYNCIMKYGLGIGIETGTDCNQVFNFKPIEDAIFSETLFWWKKYIRFQKNFHLYQE